MQVQRKENAFDLLGVTPADSKARIMERAEECSLFDDPQRVARAREMLLDTRRRLAEELSWMWARESPERSSYAALSVLLAHAQEAEECADLADTILAIAAVYEQCRNPDSPVFAALLHQICTNRAAAGMPPVHAQDLAETLDARNDDITQILWDCLDPLPYGGKEAALAEIAERATGEAQHRAPLLIERILARYEEDSRATAEGLADFLHMRMERLHTINFTNEKILDSAIMDLLAWVEQWQTSMLPLQIYCLSKGQEHAASEEFYGDVREAAIILHNEGHRMDFACRLLRKLDEMQALRYLPSKEKIIRADLALLTDMMRKVAQEIQKRKQTAASNAPLEQKNSGEDTEGSTVGCIFWLVVFLGIGYFLFFGGSGSENRQTSPPAQTQQTEQKNAAPAAQSAQKPVQPIPRTDVITGYDPEQPVRNDTGLCTVTVDNTRNDMPVYVRLWDMGRGTPVRAFYIAEGEEFTAEDLTPGLYEVRYIELYENDVPAQGAKSEQFRLEQREFYNSVQYSQISLTLYKVQNGNMQTTNIPADQI